MSIEKVGYTRLIERFGLPALPPPIISVIDTAVRGRARTRFGDQETQQFQPNFARWCAGPLIWKAHWPKI